MSSNTNGKIEEIQAEVEKAKETVHTSISSILSSFHGHKLPINMKLIINHYMDMQSTKLYIDLVIERGDKLEDIEQKSRELEEQGSLFNKNAKKTRRQLIVYIIILFHH